MAALHTASTSSLQTQRAAAGKCLVVDRALRCSSSSSSSPSPLGSSSNATCFRRTSLSTDARQMRAAPVSSSTTSCGTQLRRQLFSRRPLAVAAALSPLPKHSHLPQRREERDEGGHFSAPMPNRQVSAEGSVATEAFAATLAVPQMLEDQEGTTIRREQQAQPAPEARGEFVPDDVIKEFEVRGGEAGGIWLSMRQLHVPRVYIGPPMHACFSQAKLQGDIQSVFATLVAGVGECCRSFLSKLGPRKGFAG